MTEKDVFESYQPGDPDYEKARWALENGVSLIDFDEWCYVSEVLEQDVSFHEIHLMNQYVDVYNEIFGTDYDWGWMEYPNNTETKDFFESLIAFAKERESENP